MFNLKTHTNKKLGLSKKRKITKSYTFEKQPTKSYTYANKKLYFTNKKLGLANKKLGLANKKLGLALKNVVIPTFRSPLNN